MTKDKTDIFAPKNPVDMRGTDDIDITEVDTEKARSIMGLPPLNKEK